MSERDILGRILVGEIGGVKPVDGSRCTADVMDNRSDYRALIERAFGV